MSGANDDEYNDDNNSNYGKDIQDNNNNYKDNKIFLFAKRLTLTKSKIKYLMKVFHDTGFLDNILFFFYIFLLEVLNYLKIGHLLISPIFH